jgi:hypothetical protein
MEEGKEEQTLVFQALSCDNRVTCHVWSDQTVEPQLPTHLRFLLSLLKYNSEIVVGFPASQTGLLQRSSSKKLDLY